MSIRRDYKSITPRQRRQSVRRLGVLVITLVLIGLFSGLLAYIKGDRLQQPPVAVMPPAIAPPALPSAVQSPPDPSVTLPEPTSAPFKPKYDFYTELPKRQVDVQQEEPNPRATPPSTSPQPTKNPPRKPTTQTKKHPDPRNGVVT
ncbi:MAG: hypothetical protein H6974_02110 [Gammaproteobacteria bacterium]|nr:hypothetical protein [Gammaproteobacteria bacterium]MCP5195580.1 hypothetical protein [Gammaproteobacteria bacterium]